MFRDIVTVAAEQMEADVRILFLDPPNGLGDGTHPLRFPSANVDLTADDFIGGDDLRLCFFHQRHDLLRPFPQKHPFLGQGNASFPTDQ